MFISEETAADERVWKNIVRTKTAAFKRAVCLESGRLARLPFPITF